MKAKRKDAMADKLDDAAATRAAEEAAYRKLYGDLLPDVETIKAAGFAVHREKGGVYRVGNKPPMTADEVQEMAARIRRLEGDKRPTVRKVNETATGLRVGQVVPIASRDDKARRALSGSTPLSVAKDKLTGAALQAKQKAEQASDDLGPNPRLDWLPLEVLSIDRRYQREMGKGNWAHVNRIMREWNWLHYQPIVVAPNPEHFVDGVQGFVVIDGQHRLEAARKHPRIDRLPCYIVEAADVALQAQAFVALNARRIGVTRLQRFWAAHAAGEPVARRVHKVCSDAGVAITRSGGVLPPRTTFATFTIEKLLPLGAGVVTTALKVLAEAHGEKRDAFKSPVIYALAQLVTDKAFQRERLVAVLKRADLDRLMGDAKSWRARNGGTLEKATERTLRALYQPGRAAA